MHFSDRILSIRLGSSQCYYLPSSNGSILIDAGAYHKHHHLQSVLLAHEHDMQDIRYVILTHTHHDHVGALADIKKMTDAKIFVHKQEAAFLTKGRTPLPRGTSVTTNSLVTVGRILRIGSYPATSADFVITDELQLSEFDFDIDIISTPGHTAGSMSILVNGDLAFVGDTMFNIRHDTVFPPFANDEAALLSSWNRLLETSCQIFYPGHGRPIEREKLEQSYDKILKKRQNVR